MKLLAMVATHGTVIIRGFSARTSQHTHRYAHDKRISTCYLQTAQIRGSDCAVFNLILRAWKLVVEAMDLRRVNLFTPFLSPVLSYLGPETFLLEDTLGFDV